MNAPAAGTQSDFVLLLQPRGRRRSTGREAKKESKKEERKRKAGEMEEDKRIGMIQRVMEARKADGTRLKRAAGADTP